MTSTGNAMAMATNFRSQPLNQTQPISTPGKLAMPAASPMSAGHQNLSLKACLGGNPSGVMASAKDVEVVVFKGGMMDFPDFLRLMKWMLQANYSKINEVAEKIA